MTTSSSLRARINPRYITIALMIIAATAAVLLFMGREPICKCGTVKLWHGVVQSSENSQHLSDWYSPSHMIHGFIFFGLGWLVLRRFSIGFRLVLALIAECAWEIAENTDRVIEHYRTATISLDYYGDSVLNSVGDIGFMVADFMLASRLPVWLTVALAILFELFTGWMIRDNLILNVLMLLWPLEMVKEWQAGTRG